MGTTSVQFESGMRFVAQVASGHTVPMDASDQVGGSDTAARPLEVLLSSLGGCTGMDVISLLRKMKTEPRSFSVEIQDERAPEYPKAVTKIHLIYRIAGDVPEENVIKAVDLSLSKYCPIANTLNGVAEITYEVEILRDQ